VSQQAGEALGQRAACLPKGLKPLRATAAFACHLGEDHQDALADAGTLGTLAGVLDGLQRYTESEPIYRRVLAGFAAHCPGPSS
jgi:hypothetical protein